MWTVRTVISDVGGEWWQVGGVVGLLLFYTIATVFQACHGGDMMYEMRKPEPTLLPTQVI